MGVSGTPALVTESGEMFPGYIPAPQLAQRLGISLQQ
jgi:thiol:disulfide interchange protein DsbC